MDYQKINDILKKTPIFWINLDKSVKRREKMEQILKNIGSKCVRIEAIDGNKLDNEYLSKFKLKFNKLTKEIKGAIGCTLSHIKALTTALTYDYENVIILEDDANFDFFRYKNNDIVSEFKHLQQSLDVECLVLGMSCSKNLFNTIKDYHFVQCYETNVTNKFPNRSDGMGGTFAYIINRKGIKKILDNFHKKRMITVAEHVLFKPINVFATLPYFSHPIVNEDNHDNNKSFIDNDVKRHKSHNRSINRWMNYYK